MTKVMIPSFRWLYLVIVLYLYTKKIADYSLSSRSMTKDWFDALIKACDNQFPEVILLKQHMLYLDNDNGSQPT